MDLNADLFKTLGQVAGIGGIALGAFLTLALAVVKQSSQGSRKDANHLLRLTTWLAWSVAVLGIGAWAWSTTRSSQPPTPASGPVVQSVGGVAAGGNISDSKITVSGAQQGIADKSPPRPQP